MFALEKMKKTNLLISILVLGVVIFFSCTKEEIIQANSSKKSEPENRSKISDPYELLKKGDVELYQELETSRGGDYVNFVPGTVNPDAVESG